MSEACQYETVNDIIAELTRLRAERDALRAAFYEAQARELAAVQELDEARAALKEVKP